MNQNVAFPEAKIKSADRELERIFRLSLDLICIAGVDGYFKKVNPAFTSLLGYPERELLTTPFIEFIHPDDRDATIREVGNQLKGSPTLLFENRYRCKNGSYVWLAWNAHAVAEEGLIYAIARDITQSKDHQRLVSESETRYKEIFQQATDYILVLDPAVDGPPIIVDGNDAAFEKHGYSREELLGKPITFLDVNEHDAPQVIEERLDRMRAGNTIMFEVEHACKDGSRFKAEVVAKIVTIGGKSLLYTIERDITARKRAENALNRFVHDTSSVAGTEYLNTVVGALAALLGVKYVFIAAKLEKKPGFAQTLALWANGENACNFEYELAGTPCEVIYEKEKFICYPTRVQESFPKDFWLQDAGVESYMAAPLHDSKGAILGHVGIMDIKPIQDSEMNISILKMFAIRTGLEIERKRTDDALMESERKFRTLVEMADDGIVLTDMSFRHIYHNRAYYESLGLTEDEARDIDAVSRIHPDDREMTDEATKKLFATGKATSEYRVKHKDGSWRHRYAVSTVVSGDNNLPQYIISVVRDTTERKQLEIARENLRQAQDYFTIVTSHELRSPLSSLQLVKTLMRDVTERNAGDPAITRVNSVLDKAYKNMEKVVSATQILSNLYLKKKDHSASALKIHRPLLASVDICRDETYAAGRSIRFEVETGAMDKDVCVVCDAELLMRAVREIISNAVKYSPDGKTVWVSGVTEGDQAVIIVRDEGEGLSTKELEVVGDHYFAPSDPNRHQTGQYTYKGGGIGLGLSIAHIVVETFGGRLSIESPGKGLGVIVKVALPIARQEC